MYEWVLEHTVEPIIREVFDHTAQYLVISIYETLVTGSQRLRV